MSVLGLVSVLAVSGATVVQATGNDSSVGLVSWGVPHLPTNIPLTEEEKERGREHGRALPQPELLQPSLDPALPTFQPAYQRNELRGDLKCASSDVLPGLAKAWIAKLKEYYPKVNISVDPPYAGSLGALELIEGNLDCVFVSRELKPTDVAGFREAFGYDPFSVPISGGSYRHYGFLDAIGFAVHKDNPIGRLSFDQLDAILSTTRHRGGAPIRTWGDLGLTGEWADKPIHIYGIAPWNGFEEFTRQRVLNYNGNRGEWRSGVAAPGVPKDPDVTWESTVFKVAEHIANDRYALGYTGLAYVDQPVKMLALSDHNNSPVYAPTYENVATAEYPLSRLIYLNFNCDPQRPVNAIFAELLRLILSEQGQQIVRAQGIYLPLRSEQAVRSREMLR
ncbi:PstS family phosphate ABC transporter substrate-binding protein [Micromonospora sp. NPDC007230]|uniref:PstS family phosphate ABC transporter substrate-binding protein n=1 Tax=Micromonospora sp. NPDC007230 TaxID=3364237 RepID=UPI0036C3C6BE